MSAADWVPGILAGTAFFALSEATVPEDANCSYLASPATDLLAIALGAGLVIEGQKLQSWWVRFAGAAMMTIHIWQGIRKES